MEVLVWAGGTFIAVWFLVLVIFPPLLIEEPDVKAMGLLNKALMKAGRGKKWRQVR